MAIERDKWATVERGLKGRRKNGEKRNVELDIPTVGVAGKGQVLVTEQVYEREEG